MDAQLVAMTVRPLLAAIVVLIGAFGIHFANADPIVSAAATVIGAAVVLGISVWGLLHGKKLAAQTQEAAAVAYVAGSQDGVRPQNDPDHPVVQAAARNAVASVK